MLVDAIYLIINWWQVMTSPYLISPAAVIRRNVALPAGGYIQPLSKKNAAEMKLHPVQQEEIYVREILLLQLLNDMRKQWSLQVICL